MTTKIATKVQLNGALDTARWQRTVRNKGPADGGKRGKSFLKR
jgi:hypothetical protein